MWLPRVDSNHCHLESKSSELPLFDEAIKSSYLKVLPIALSAILQLNTVVVKCLRLDPPKVKCIVFLAYVCCIILNMLLSSSSVPELLSADLHKLVSLFAKCYNYHVMFSFVWFTWLIISKAQNLVNLQHFENYNHHSRRRSQKMLSLQLSIEFTSRTQCSLASSSSNGKLLYAFHGQEEQQTLQRSCHLSVNISYCLLSKVVLPRSAGHLGRFGRTGSPSRGAASWTPRRCHRARSRHAHRRCRRWCPAGRRRYPRTATCWSAGGAPTWHRRSSRFP